MSFIHLKDVDLDLPVGGRPLAGLFQRRKRASHDARLDIENNVGFVRALRNITLNIDSGDRVGLVGVNGAGKSTLLRVLAGIYAPTRGEYASQGKISTLFSSVVGMNQNASGRENILLSGRTLGMSRNEIAAVEQEIVDFADLGDFIDLPIRLYSAGMKTRLGFAIATAINPEILLIDEVFGVGDRNFSKRANERIVRVVGQAGILVLATHSDLTITRFCNKVCWIDKGEVRFLGEVEEGIEKYRASSQNGQNRK
ncbi:MAG: ATP-binding cassette domain-containing protein [Pseudomonadota bacterium]